MTMKTVIRPETEMKDSGVKYVGLIPRTWKIVQLKYCTNCLDGKRVPIDASLRKSGIYPYWGAGRIMDYVDDYIFDEKLVLLGEDGAPFFDDFRPVSHLIDGKVWVNNHIHVLRTKDNIVDSYLVHALNSVDYHEYINGSILNKLTQSNMNRIKIPLPSIAEQQAIANYLDETCSKIDEIIAEAKASIDEYKELKQSVIFEAVTKGLDKNVEEKECQMVSLQQIPKHWKECRMGTIYRESKETGRTDLPILMISINTGISDGEVGDEERLRKVVRSEDKSVYKVVRKNDLAYNMMRAWQGGFGAAQVDGLVSPAYVVATPRTKLDSRYIEALLRTPMFTEKIRGLSYGIADFRLRLYWNYFKDLKICLPPVDEQRKIADFIDEQNKMIEGLISEKQSLIADLEAYKKSLIYEVVTGKRRVV